MTEPTTPIDYAHCISVASEVARAAGAIIREALLKPKNIDNKSALDLVTDTGSNPPETIHGGASV